MNSVLFIAGVLLSILSAYFFFMVAAGFFGSGKGAGSRSSRRHSFAIVIPAHNEEELIGRTIRSLQEVDYPEALYDIFVIADNCTDGTAAIARGNGVRCFERKDERNRGKGFALKWFFESVFKGLPPRDACVIVDADTLVSGNLLSEMNQALCEGHKAATVRYDILDSDRSGSQSIASLGFSLRNLRNAGLSRFGGSAPLLGTGMSFSAEVLARYGWSSTSIVEDREQWAYLYLNGVVVKFIDAARVAAVVPSRWRDFSVPRARWDIGGLSINRRYAKPFAKHFCRDRSVPAFLTLLEILSPPFYYIALTDLGYLAISLLDGPARGASPFIVIGTINAFMVFTCLVLGLARMEGSPRLYWNVTMHLPYILFWRSFNLARGYWRRTSDTWLRSKRESTLKRGER